MHDRRFNWTVRALLLTGVFSISVLTLGAQTPADNTKVNTRDRAKTAVTADQQKDNARDLEITKAIRSAVVDDKNLSTYAHNVKIVTQGGQVTLKGPVRSDEEKKNIEAKAVAVAGADRVINQISIAPAKPAKK